MYESVASDWIEEMLEKGKLSPMTENEKSELASKYAAIIEAMLEKEAEAALATMGKSDEYERMKLFDGQYLSKYLNQTIPGFFNFKMEALQKAKNMIVDGE